MAVQTVAQINGLAQVRIQTPLFRNAQQVGNQYSLLQHLVWMDVQIVALESGLEMDTRLVVMINNLSHWSKINIISSNIEHRRLHRL